MFVGINQSPTSITFRPSQKYLLNIIDYIKKGQQLPRPMPFDPFIGQDEKFPTMTD